MNSTGSAAWENGAKTTASPRNQRILKLRIMTKLYWVKRGPSKPRKGQNEVQYRSVKSTAVG